VRRVVYVPVALHHVREVRVVDEADRESPVRVKFLRCRCTKDKRVESFLGVANRALK
jgi:hypothetical protein